MPRILFLLGLALSHCSGVLSANVSAIPSSSSSNSSVYEGNATATRCRSPCDATNVTCTPRTNTLSLKTRISYRSLNASFCPTQGAAFCPVVDQFSALDLVPLAAEVLACSGMEIEVFSSAKYSPESVLDKIPFTQDGLEKCAELDDLNVSRRAYADMLVFNVTLRSGLWNLAQVENSTILSGTGFQRTCDDQGVCMFDADLPCIGGDEGRNGLCARCLTRSQLEQGRMIHPTIYVAFYGTGPSNQRLLSGNQNPLNFRKYALGGVYSVLISAKDEYIAKVLDFDWKSLIPNISLVDFQIPDFGSILDGIVDKLRPGGEDANDEGGAGNAESENGHVEEGSTSNVTNVTNGTAPLQNTSNNSGVAVDSDSLPNANRHDQHSLSSSPSSSPRMTASSSSRSQSPRMSTLASERSPITSPRPSRSPDPSASEQDVNPNGVPQESPPAVSDGESLSASIIDHASGKQTRMD